MNNSNNVMVCVTRQKNCERLIKYGKKISDKLNGKLYVIHVAKTGTSFLGNPDESEALEFLYQASNNAGADMAVLRSDNVVNTMIKFAKDNNIAHIVLGEPPKGKSDNTIIEDMEKSLPDTKLIIVPA